MKIGDRVRSTSVSKTGPEFFGKGETGVIVKIGDWFSAYWYPVWVKADKDGLVIAVNSGLEVIP